MHSVAPINGKMGQMYNPAGNFAVLVKLSLIYRQDQHRNISADVLIAGHSYFI